LSVCSVQSEAQGPILTRRNYIKTVGYRQSNQSCHLIVNISERCHTHVSLTFAYQNGRGGPPGLWGKYWMQFDALGVYYLLCSGADDCHDLHAQIAAGTSPKMAALQKPPGDIQPPDYAASQEAF
jgi:hypothetical protein